MPQRMTYWLTSLCASAVLVSAGCATVGVPWTRAETNPSAVAAPSEESISLSYRTDSDRLNLSGGLLSGRIQAAAYQPGGITPIPPVTTSKLRVYYPHPQGIPATALAVVSFEAQTAGETNGALAMWKKLTGGQNEPAGPIAPQEVWSMDFPKAELDAILAKLRRQNFFETIPGARRQHPPRHRHQRGEVRQGIPCRGRVGRVDFARPAPRSADSGGPNLKLLTARFLVAGPL